MLFIYLKIMKKKETIYQLIMMMTILIITISNNDPIVYIYNFGYNYKKNPRQMNNNKREKLLLTL